MVLTIDLGEDRLSSLNSTIDLNIHASAQVLIPEDTGLTDAACIERLLKSQDLWVFQTPELKLYISVNIDASIVLSASTFASSVGEMMCSSKVFSWSASESYSHLHYGDVTSFKLIIGIQRDLSQSKTRPTRKTTLFDYLDDIHPPDYIKTSTQDTISFDPQPDLYTYNPGNTQATSFIDELEGLLESEQSPLTPTESFQNIPAKEQREQLNNLFTIGLEALLFGCTAPSNQSDLQSKKRQPLSQLAPSVFNPNYHREMSQRSTLIPSITKSLSSILKLPNHQSLQSKLGKLNNGNTLHPTGANTDTNSIRNTISASLFRIAQKQLYKPQASRKLRFQAPPPNPQCEDQPSPVKERMDGEPGYSSDGEEELLGFSEPDESSSCAMLSTTTAAAPSSSCGSLPFSQDDYDDDDDDIMSNGLSEDGVIYTLFSDDMVEFEGFGDDHDEDDMLCNLLKDLEFSRTIV
ncbi:similar to An04g01400 [Aspergillus luchuensis]|uniref:Similar to An04g01400 n=1 Tax=Aspergillus kawachii TaxID=1069201 RepID=A0A146FI59_ASPKA|nr:similar to An04g01400 [Aspergillus luchuensis]